MQPLEPFQLYINLAHWGLPVSLSYWQGRVAIAILCLHIEFGKT